MIDSGPEIDGPASRACSYFQSPLPCIETIHYYEDEVRGYQNSKLWHSF